MAQGITFDINARVTGYEASLEQMKRAFSKVDPGSDIGQKLSKAIKTAEEQLKGLQKNLSPHASSHTQLDAIVEKVNTVGESILNVATLMQRVSTADLNFSSFGDEINNLRKQIVSLEDELENNLSTGLQNFAEQSDTVKNVFDNILKIDIKDKGPAELFSALSQGAKKAIADTQEAEKELERMQRVRFKQESQLSDLMNGPFGTAAGRDQLQNQVRSLKTEYDAVFEQLKTSLTKSLNDKLKDNSDINADEILNNFFKGLSPENIKERISNMYDELNKAGIYSRRGDMYNELFGGGRNVNDVVKNINLGDLKPIIEKFQAFIDSIASGIGGKNKAILEDFLNQRDLDSFTASTLTNINTAFGRIQNAIQKHKDKIDELLKQESTQEGQVNAAKATESTIKSAEAELRKELQQLQVQYNDLQQQINQLRNETTTKQEGYVKQVKDESLQGGSAAQQYQITAEEVAKYNAQLDQVHEKEKLVGKIEGVVQRWFSIYAAVRMVGNAIRSVISTIQELDKTITEIAIVTDMTQDQLWDQMSDYTTMARQYAASISGVYQVSQLYYQQGGLNI